MLGYALLGLLAVAPRHGYELKAAFEELLGGTWSLNIGQVYTTLSRLERDGFVESEVVPQEALPDRKVYSLTKLGHKELDRWLGEAAPGAVRLKDEFVLKVLVHAKVVGDPRPLVSEQRGRHLQTLARLQAEARRKDAEPTHALLVENAILHLEADLKWLDLFEQRYRR